MSSPVAARHDRLKRGIDISGAAAGLLLLALPLLLVAVAIRLTLGRPVFFRQSRPGLHAKSFTLYKFRTMRVELDEEGRPLPDEDRLTRLGAFLRTTSMDELPELWNVMQGDMSLVGPRPLLEEYLPLYSAEQARRHAVRPGITGLAQVDGRNALSWEDKLALDCWYVDHRSIWLDLRILARTLVKVVRRDGISQPGHVTAERFRGSAESRFTDT